MASEITEEQNEESLCMINTEVQKDKIRRIIDYQKSLNLSSSSSSSVSSTAASYSSFSSSRQSSSLLELMKGGSTSLRRLFDMEHTNLGTFLKEYSGSPITKPIYLWGSDTDDGSHDDPWFNIRQIGGMSESRSDGQRWLTSEGSLVGQYSKQHSSKPRKCNRKLIRTKSFKRLPRFNLWNCGGLKFRLRLRRWRIWS